MSRLSHIDGLRGAASLAVCWFHMSHGGKLLGDGVAAQLSSLGFLGVEVFFVISGFVIPLSMGQSQYRLGTFGGYLGKRLLRVHPPFVVACLLSAGLNFLSMRSPGYAGSLSDGYPMEVLRAIGRDSLYLSGILGRPWILVVAWTLAIEIQFYLLAGLVFPLVAKCGAWSRAMAFPLLAGTAWIFPDSRFLPAFLPFFALGWSGIGLRERVAWPEIAGAVSTSLVMFTLCPLPAAITAVLALAFIVFWKTPVSRWWLWLGAVSYSLYLVHVPVGGRVVNLLGRFFTSGWQMGFVALLGTLTSLVAAWLFWKIIERPFHRLSRSRKDRPACAPVG